MEILPNYEWFVNRILKIIFLKMSVQKGFSIFTNETFPNPSIMPNVYQKP